MAHRLHIIAPLATAALVASASAAPEFDAAQNLNLRGRSAAAEAAHEYRRLAYFEQNVVADRASAVRRTAGNTEIVPPAAVRMFTVHFAVGSANPDPGAAAAIAEAVRAAQAYPGLRIVLGGHTDRSGGAARNQQLSQRRAEAVARLLRDAGLADNDIMIIGFGETYPLNKTPDGMHSDDNRRVEIVVGPGASS